MLRQSLLVVIQLLISLGASASPAPFVPYGADELKKLSPEQKRQEMLVFTADLYDFLAEEILFRSNDSDLREFYLAQKHLCLDSVRENPIEFFVKNADIMYLKKDFNGATNPAYMKCIQRVSAAFDQNPKMRSNKGLLRPEIDVASVIALQENNDFMKRMSQRYPQNFLVRFHMGIYQAGHFLKAGDVPTPVAFPAQPAPPTPEQIAEQQKKLSAETNPTGLFVIGGLFAFMIGLWIILARRHRE